MSTTPLNDIQFTKTKGGLGRKTANEDPISGLLMLLPELSHFGFLSGNLEHPFTELETPDGTNDLYVAKLRYPEDLATLGEGIKEEELSTRHADNTADEYKEKSAKNAVVYHVTEFFRMNPESVLYLGIKTGGTAIHEKDIAALQNWANGTIRQCGVLTSKLRTKLGDYQAECVAMEGRHTPLSLICTDTGCTVTVTNPTEPATELTVTPAEVSPYKLTDLTSTSTNLTSAGRCNVSVLVGFDHDNDLIQKKLGYYGYYGCLGTCLGAVSKAAVHECIAWVQKFPLGLKEPGLICDKIISEVSTSDQEAINDNRYIFVRTHVGNADNYFNDSHTLDEATSDYAYIENVRTIDKACRGVCANLLPYLCSPLKVDAETGQLDPGTVAFLETTAGKALEDMEKAGELSGYRAEIDPEQDVLATSQVEVVIKNVPMGVMRKVHVKIGFTTSLS